MTPEDIEKIEKRIAATWVGADLAWADHMAGGEHGYRRYLVSLARVKTLRRGLRSARKHQRQYTP